MANLIELLKNNKELRKQARQLISLAVGEMAEKRTNINFDDWFDNKVREGNNADAGENTLPMQRVSGSALDVAKQIPQVPQTQAALNDQLKILRIAANKLGLYDAADFIKRD